MRNILLILLMGLALSCRAQCPAKNNAFNAGEQLTYDLYFNWGLIWIKCGTATYSIGDRGDEYTSHLLFTTNKKFDKFFTIRDTLNSVVTKDLVPKYYSKASLEGGAHRYEEVHYSYAGGKTNARLRYVNPDFKVWKNEVKSDECIYDMMSMMTYARSFDVRNYKVGQRLHFLMTSSENVIPQTIIYKGKEKFKANDGNTYCALVFSLLDDESTKERELVRFYFSDDDNHLPLRLDFFLKFGSAKGFFVQGKNIRHPMKSIIKKK